MKSTKNLLSLILFCALIIFSCQQDDTPSQNNNDDPQENIPDTFSEYFGNEISRDFLGSVIDSNHNPIEGATISIGNETAITDSNGVFIIRDASVNERFGYIKAEKVGYIHASRSVVPSNGTNKVTIMMLEETVAGSVNSGSSSTITTDDGSSINFDGNFIKEDGTAYSGSVDVIIHHLDPTDDDMELQMPGMLYAQNEDGAERMLQTLGMLAVELRGSSGEDLNLAEGSTSEIQIPVDPSLLTSAPATIPLWYFDEATGYWKEEGIATLQGNMYVSTVSHFSFWSFCIPIQTTPLILNIIDQSSNPIFGIEVSIKSLYYGRIKVLYTNENGQVANYVPINDTMEINIYSSENCGDYSIQTLQIEPLNSTTIIDIIVNDSPNIVSQNITGNLKDCNGNLITDGYIKMVVGNKKYYKLIHNGEININFNRCDSQNAFSIEAYDNNSSQISDYLTFDFSFPSTNIGDLLTCNDHDEFVIFSINETNALIYGHNIWVDYNAFYDELSITSGGWIGNSYINLKISNASVGSYHDSSETLGNIKIAPINGDTSEWSFSSQNFTLESHLSNFGAINEYVDFIFSGTHLDDNNQIHNISGTVHLKRDQ